MNLKETQNVCNRLRIKPSRKLGQNFLIDEEVEKRIIEVANISRDDMVLEIGPGLGVLTDHLVKKTDNLMVVEMDRKISSWLLKKYSGLKLINDDVLKVDLKESGIDGDFKIVSNLPYQITSPVLWNFLQDGDVKPVEMVLMVQREVADRIVALPSKMSVMSVMCQFYAECEKVFNVDRSSFWPEPDVESSVIRLRPKKQVGIDGKELMHLVKMGFSSKRKMLKNNLSNGLQVSQDVVLSVLKKVGLDEKVRAQVLSVDDWVKLYKEMGKLS